jgi:hypothetical protein
VGTEIAFPFPAMIFEFMREPSVMIGEELELTIFERTYVRLEIHKNMFPSRIVRIRG